MHDSRKIVRIIHHWIPYCAVLYRGIKPESSWQVIRQETQGITWASVLLLLPHHVMFMPLSYTYITSCILSRNWRWKRKRKRRKRRRSKRRNSETENKNKSFRVFKSKETDALNHKVKIYSFTPSTRSTDSTNIKAEIPVTLPCR